MLTETDAEIDAKIEALRNRYLNQEETDQYVDGAVIPFEP